jgi:hypothetical protein
VLPWNLCQLISYFFALIIYSINLLKIARKTFATGNAIYPLPRTIIQITNDNSIFRKEGKRSKNCLPFVRTWDPARFFGEVRLVHLFNYLCCPIMCLYLLSSVLWCSLRFAHNTMFGSSSSLVFCRRAHVLFTLYRYVFVCAWWCPTHIVLCFCFVFLRLVYPILPVSLDCVLLLPLRYSLTFIHYNKSFRIVVLIETVMVVMYFFMSLKEKRHFWFIIRQHRTSLVTVGFVT